MYICKKSLVWLNAYEDNNYKSLNYVKIWLSFIMHMQFSFWICNLNYDTNSMHIYNICYAQTLSMNFALNFKFIALIFIS